MIYKYDGAGFAAQLSLSYVLSEKGNVPLPKTMGMAKLCIIV